MSSTELEQRSYLPPATEERAELKEQTAELEAIFRQRSERILPVRIIDRVSSHVTKYEELYVVTMGFPLVATAVAVHLAGGGLFESLLAGAFWPLALLGSGIYDRLSKRRIRATLRRIRTTADRIGYDVNSWLKETYGFSFSSQEDQSWIGERLVGYQGETEPLQPLAPGLIGTRDLVLSSGASVRANFYLTESGGLEIRKAQVKDSTESPYFSTLREELS